MRRLLATALMLALAALSYGCGKQARAADDPPAVGQTSRISLLSNYTTSNWTPTTFRNGSSVSLTVDFTAKNAATPGATEAKITWPASGEYWIRFLSNRGDDMLFTQSVVSSAPFTGGAVASVTAPVTVGTNNDKTGYALSVTPPTAAQIDAQLTSTHPGNWAATGGTTTAFVNWTSGESYFAGKHGRGQWGGITLTAPGPANSPVLVGQDYHVPKGNSASFSFCAQRDITGLTIKRGAKVKYTDTVYAIPLKDITADVTDALTGTVTINLTTTETNITPRTYLFEVQASSVNTKSTIFRFNLIIDPVVIP